MLPDRSKLPKSNSSFALPGEKTVYFFKTRTSPSKLREACGKEIRAPITALVEYVYGQNIIKLTLILLPNR